MNCLKDYVQLREYVPAVKDVPQYLTKNYLPPRNVTWKPIVSYEDVDFKPPLIHPRSNRLLDSSYRLARSAVEPLRFPNLVTCHERDPEHASRTAMFQRYSEREWLDNSIKNYVESDCKRNFSHRLRNDIVRTVRNTDEKAIQGQSDAGKRIGERLNDITFWKNELSMERDRVLETIDQLNYVKQKLETAIAGLEGPKHVTQECLYHREKRPGIELVHDKVEKSLLGEVETERKWQNRYSTMSNKVKEQLNMCRAAQHEIENDLKNKDNSYSIENLCHRLNNYSKDINLFDDIERFDQTTTTHENWCRATESTLRKSQNERAHAVQLMSETENTLKVGADEVWEKWANTNSAYSTRIDETLEVKNTLQHHLHKVQQEIFDVEKTIELLTKAIQDKAPPLKVAQTRLQARIYRLEPERCQDAVQERLVKEVKDLQESLDDLHHKFAVAKNNHQALLKIRLEIEDDLRKKTTALFLDRDQCMGLRRGYPISSAIKF